jgi:hypothetical protein
MMDIPVFNARVSAARDERGDVIGVEITCLFTHDQISALPEKFAKSAADVLERALGRTLAGWEPGAPFQLFKCPHNMCNGRLGKAGDLCLACGSRLGEERIRK